MRKDAIWDRPSWPLKGNPTKIMDQLNEFIKNDKTYLEREPMERVAKEGQLFAYQHTGFWQCMDTKRERDSLEKLWKENKSPWKRK